MRNLNRHLALSVVGVASLIAGSGCLKFEGPQSIIAPTPITAENNPAVRTPRTVSMRNYFRNKVDPDRNEWLRFFDSLGKPISDLGSIPEPKMASLRPIRPSDKVSTDYDGSGRVALFFIESALLNPNFSYGLCANNQPALNDCNFFNSDQYDIFNGSISSAGNKSRNFVVIGLDSPQTPELMKSSGLRLQLIELNSNGLAGKYDLT